MPTIKTTTPKYIYLFDLKYYKGPFGLSYHFIKNKKNAPNNALHRRGMTPHLLDQPEDTGQEKECRDRAQNYHHPDAQVGTKASDNQARKETKFLSHNFPLVWSFSAVGRSERNNELPYYYHYFKFMSMQTKTTLFIKGLFFGSI